MTMQEARPVALHPKGVNHLAISTCDMKAQITFFAEVLGCPLKALYWMHGVPDTFHGFVELAPESYVAFVQHPKNNAEIVWGVSHAGTAGSPVTAGAMQHVAFHVDSLDDMLALRDRIRSHGIQVMGPIDHGMVQSMYFAGLEGLSLEICTGGGIDERAWIDPEVQALCGISADELDALKFPAVMERPSVPVPQPPLDLSKPQMHYPVEVLTAIMGISDKDMWEQRSITTPPVVVDDGA
jgi:catechol 2,3-dioxygenase-like lactoylglutathione lyase family enzyme